MFSNAPQVGDVIFSSEKEKIENLFKLINTNIEIRKKAFVEYGGNIDEYNANSENKIPKLFIVINNFETFRLMYSEYDDKMKTLPKEMIKYGIYFIITASDPSGILYTIVDNFKNKIELQQKSKTGGRGYITIDEKKYEFQTAKVTKEENEKAFIKEFCENLKNNSSWKIPKIPVVPDVVNIEIIQEYISESNNDIPIGVETESLEVNCYDFSKSPINLIVANDYEMYNAFASSLLELYANLKKYETYVIDTKNNSLKIPEVCKKACNKVDICDILTLIYEEIARRFNLSKKAKDEGNELPEFEKMVIIIDSISSLVNDLDSGQKKDLNELLLYTSSKFNVTIILLEEIRNISKISFNEWFKNNININDGIWVGPGILDQYTINISPRTNEMREEIGKDFGFVINKGRATKVKLINLEDK